MAPSLSPVLTIGVAGHAGMTKSQMAEATKSMTSEAAKAGFAFDAIFIDKSFPADDQKALLERLKAQKWEVVQIGSGLRLSTEQTRLLEDVVNLVLATVQPTPKLAFPTTPDEMIPTFARLLQKTL